MWYEKPESQQGGSLSKNTPLLVTIVLTGLLGLHATPASAESVDESDAPVLTEPDTQDPASIFDENEFAELSLEDLMNVQVTSVAGVAVSSFQTPAAITVLSNEHINRSGHQSLVDLLRLVPGATVQQAQNTTWSTGIRGRQATFSANLLALRDGRQIYDPAFGGVNWDIHDMILQDIDRIEVIRGPGATLWGSNAVNGVVNIESKSAKDTQGLLVSGIVGDQLETVGQARYGGQIDDDTYYRVWAKYTDRDGLMSATAPGTRNFDSLDAVNGGFRIDQDFAEDTVLTIDSGFFQSDHIGEYFLAPGFVPADTYAMNAYILGRVKKETDDAGYSVQGYFDWYERRAAFIDNYEHFVADVEYKQHQRWGDEDEHQLVWGAHYQFYNDDYDSPPAAFIFFIPPNENHHRVDGFLQNTTTIVPDEWFVMVGSKFEYNTHSQFNIQPNVRLWHTPCDQETWWASFSRPVRTPSRFNEDILIVGPLGRSGNRSVENEEVIVFEAGHRRQLSEELSIDVALFSMQHRDLIAATGIPPQVNANVLREDTYGGEISAMWRPHENTSVEASYSYAQVDIDDLTGLSAGTKVFTPEHTGIVQVNHDLTERIQLHANAYITSNQPSTSAGSNTRLDTGLTYRIDDKTTISLWGQNLLSPAATEVPLDADTIITAQVPRSLYLQITFED